MKNSYSAGIREELVRRTLLELGIPEKGKEKMRPCCGDAFLRGAFLCAGVSDGDGVVLPSGHGDLPGLCAHILRRFHEEESGSVSDGGKAPLRLPSALAGAFLSRKGKSRGGCEQCQRLFLRAAFLACGTVTDPAKGYRAVFRCRTDGAAEEITNALKEFSLSPGVSATGQTRLVYLKRGEEICDLLVALGDSVDAMRLQAYMVETSVRSGQNRKQNFELANVQKAVNVAQNVITDIRYLTEKGVMGTLPEPLRQAARIRLENPDLSLKELCLLFPGAISKSGLNHRLQKLSGIAREKREEEKRK